MPSSTVTPPRSRSGEPSENGGSKPTGLALASVIMVATVLLSRVLGVVRDAIISHYFGRGVQTDAYNAAFTVPDLLWNLLQSGALSSSIIPIITEYRQRGKDKTAEKVVSIVATAIFIFIGLLIVLMEIFTLQLTRMLNPGWAHHGYDDPQVALAIPLTRVLLPAQMCFFLGGLLMGVLYSRKQFLIPALGPVIYNSGIIAGAIFLRPVLQKIAGPSHAVEGLVWGAIGGAFVGNLLLPYLAVRRLGVRILPSVQFLHPGAVKVWRMVLPIGLGVGLPSIDQAVNKSFASFYGAGDTTAVMNAYRLMLLPIGVFAQSLALAVFPTLSEQAGQQNYKAMRATLNQSLRNILFLTIPASALMFVLGQPIIAFLLQSGKYTGSDTVATASVLRYFSVGIFAWACSSLLTRGFYALQSSKIPAISGAIVSVIFISMNWLVLHVRPSRLVLHVRFSPHFGVVLQIIHEAHRLPIYWLAISTSLAAAIHAGALLFLLTRRLKGIQAERLLASTIRTLLATSALVVAASVMNRAVISFADVVVMRPKVEAILALAVSGGLGLAAFYAVARLLHMPELAYGTNLVTSKMGGIKRIFARR